ncbi:leucyl aminopeptidase family protein [Dankookia sp. GCM10030260]|uniref:leucyl aminopeptidase family protein n=1 Tax=Dankookia sp. GCM10030260 TaxID=3273390 RepID=UPI003611EC18
MPLHCVAPGGLAALRDRLAPEAAGFLEASGFEARPQEVRLLPGGGGVAGAVLGLGEAEPTVWSFGGLANALPAGSTWRLADPAHGADAVLGWALGAYRYGRFKPAGRAPARLVPPPGTERAQHTAAAILRVRDLVNTPPNLLGPAELAWAAQDLAARHGGRCTIVEGAALEEGFPALAAVGQASPRTPRVAILEWGRPEAPLVALCGKGVCFDSGGLDLKPAAGMLRMKKDMGGAALVLGVAELVMRLGLPVRLLVLVGAVENAVAGNAFRPLDVLRTRAGLTVEIGNTDAEGRLVLADLLAFAAEREPELLVDCATLTGAARVALGPDLPALMTPDDALAAVLSAAGDLAADPVWRLPLHGGYDSWLDSAVADLNNVSSRPMAGAIIGGLFLRRFVPGAMRWAHLDVYAWNDNNRPGRPEGGEAQALRALVGAIETLFGGIPGPGR